MAHVLYFRRLTLLLILILTWISMVVHVQTTEHPYKQLKWAHISLSLLLRSSGGCSGLIACQTCVVSCMNVSARAVSLVMAWRTSLLSSRNIQSCKSDAPNACFNQQANASVGLSDSMVRPHQPSPLFIGLAEQASNINSS